MALHIDDDLITSDACSPRAVRRPQGGWIVDGRLGMYSRNQAITAMTLHEVYARNEPPDDPIWVHVAAWERELEEPAPPSG